MKRGYARVSRQDQDLGRQIEALTKAGCEAFYPDKISGKAVDRPELERLLNDLQIGDIIVVQKLDRLGRSLQHLMQLADIFKSKDCGFISLTESFDTTTPQGRMVFQIIGCIAEFERSIIQERTKDALHFKKLQGVVLGRRFKDYSEDIALYKKLQADGKDNDLIKLHTGWKKNKLYKIISLL